MILNNYNKRGRRSLMILSLNAVLLIAVGLILPLTRVEAAAAASTTINVYNEQAAFGLAKVSVFDASNGRQVANGMTDPLTGLFTFRSPANKELVIAAESERGYMGSARVAPGSFGVVITNEIAREVIRDGFIAPSLAVLNLKDANGASLEAVFTFKDAGGFGAPIAHARVAVVDDETFAGVMSAMTNGAGQFIFRIPADGGSGNFNGVVWSDDGAVTVVRLQLIDLRHPADGFVARPLDS